MVHNGSMAHHHDISLVVVATLICLLGAGLTVRLFIRLRQRPERMYWMHLGLTSLIGGSTIWTTHFIAMLAYDPGVPHGYAPGPTILSLVVAVAGMSLSFLVAIMARVRHRAKIGGAIFGLTTSLMHYIGMSAYLIQGQIIWNPWVIMLSTISGVVLGSIAYHRVVYPVTRFCWLGGTVGMVAAICVMHFTGMAAVTIIHQPTAAVPFNPISDMVLAVSALTAMIVVLVMGLSTFLIEARLEQETQDQLAHITLLDQLTQLPNRLSLQKKMLECDTDIQAGRLDRLGVITIDIDRFKQINDVFGHSTGDLVLKTIADRFRAVLGPGEYIARTGSNEFVAVKTYDVIPDSMIAFAERLRREIIKPVAQGIHSHRVCASIGLSSCPEDGNDINALLANSDIAMHQAKTNPNTKICFFKMEMHAANKDRIALASDLRTALARHQFCLHYQQQNATGSHDIIGFEALLRWVHPTRGTISPGSFIPIAEETGLILDIGRWVLRTAVTEAASWQNAYPIAVNVAPQQLVEPSFVETVADVLMEAGLAPSRLELEITEASIIDDKQNTLAVMNRLKKMGVRIAMDDFGIGYSSLATLQTFPFDKIKIDRSFVSGVNRDAKRAAIVRATLLIGIAFDIPVLAEGVEDEDDLEFLIRENCHQAQGFFFGKPVPQSAMCHMTGRTTHATGDLRRLSLG